MENLSFYPTLTDEMLESAGCVCGKYEFSYMIDGNYRNLRPRGKSSVRLEDSLESWKIEDDGLRICRQIFIENPQVLKGPNGVLCSAADMGVCMIWNNRTLTQKGYIMPDSVVCKGNNLYVNFSYEIAPGEVKGDLSIQTALYVKKAAERPQADEVHLINEAGVIVGLLDNIYLDFDSLYMEFPIKDVKDPSLPLWWLELNQWDDPTQNPFNEDYVCLYLNSHYSHCPKVGDTIKNIDVLIEIISTSYLMILKKIEEMGYLQRTMNGVDLEAKSISQVMYYFYTSCDPSLRTESIDMLQKTIHMNIEKMLRGESAE